MTTPECEMYYAVDHKLMIFTSHSREECEAQWKESLTSPDPEGMKSRHICQPVTEPL